jgi:hypothetical protein
MTFITWKEEEGRRVRWVYDDDYQTVGSYAYETEEETKQAEDWELERLRDGRLVALGCIVERPCCECGQWVQVDSLWGIVIEPDEEKLRAFRKECLQ